MYGGQGQGESMEGYKDFSAAECEDRMQIVSVVADRDMTVDEVNVMSFGTFPFFNHDEPEEEDEGWFDDWFEPAATDETY